MIFDLDGVIMDSEQLWDQARRETVEEHQGIWPEGATQAMQGMSSKEWAAYLRDRARIDLSTDEIVAGVLQKLLASYRGGLPLIPGAVKAVQRISQTWPLGLASSSNREVIDTVLELSGLVDRFAATVSSEEVPRGKPSPDVYVEAARRLGVPPSKCCAVEDSANGIRSASTASTCVVAVPNSHYPPDGQALARADLVLSSLDELTAEAIAMADGLRNARKEDQIDEAEVESFPASDPHSDWAGPP